MLRSLAFIRCIRIDSRFTRGVTQQSLRSPRDQRPITDSSTEFKSALDRIFASNDNTKITTNVKQLLNRGITTNNIATVDLCYLMFVFGRSKIPISDELSGLFCDLIEDRELDGLLTSQSIGVLRNAPINAFSNASKQLIAVFAKKLKQCTQQMNWSEISTCLFALHNLSEKSAESILQVLVKKMETNRGRSASFAIGMSMYGLQRMRSDSPEVKQVLTHLTKMLRASTFALDTWSVGNALYGLQRMSTDDKEVADILVALTEKIVVRRKPSLNCQAYGNAIFGLLNISFDKSTKPLLVFLIKCIQSSIKDPNLSFQDAVSIYQPLLLVYANTTFSLHKSIVEYELLPKVKSILEKVKSVFKVYISSEVCVRSDTEVTYAKHVQTFMKKSGLLVGDITFNGYLDAFEADIVFQIKLSGGKKVWVNVEVDGVYHKSGRAMRFCALRDDYLLRFREVLVVRLDALAAEREKKSTGTFVDGVLGKALASLVER